MKIKARRKVHPPNRPRFEITDTYLGGLELLDHDMGYFYDIDADFEEKDDVFGWTDQDWWDFLFVTNYDTLKGYLEDMKEANASN